jgi:predicted Zn-dependent peptidase
MAGASGNRPQTHPVSQPAIVRDVFPNGLRLLTERMPNVRSVSIGVWLARGSRHETMEQSGIAHFVEHMLFKGTATRTDEDIAQTVDSIGGQMGCLHGQGIRELLLQSAR